MEAPVHTGAFFAFMREREQVRLRKEADLPRPWTDDAILQEFKFTNVRRHYDWTTTKLREEFYQNYRSDDRRAILMNCALARYFGTFEFMEAVGWQTYEDFDFAEIIDTAERRLSSGLRVFTGAYVITNQGISAPKQEVVVDYFLRDLHKAVPELLKVVQMTRSWQKVAEQMSKIGGFGGTGFMTKEILLDTMMTDFWDLPPTYLDGYPLVLPADYSTWTPIGPGGLRGAARLLGYDYPEHNTIRPTKALETILTLTDVQGEHWPKEYGKLYPTDIQFQLCEFDKYERVRLGQGRPRSRYRPR
jgi:hypothetical protein